MVRIAVFIVACFSFFAGHLSALDTRVTVKLSGKAMSAYFPIKGKVFVMKEEGASVDEEGFLLGKEVLKVKYLGEEEKASLAISGGGNGSKTMVISIYSFEIEGQPEGVQMLKPISVAVGGRRYSSHPFVYEVRRAEETRNFRLESNIVKKTLYPGEQTDFIYRIYFKRDVRLINQHLPLSDAEGFLKVGDEVVEGRREEEYTIHEIKQRVEADKPGVYDFGPSALEGYTYKKDFFGREIFIKPLLRAKSGKHTVEVLAFPQKSRPESFAGAIGEFSFLTELHSPEEIYVGDTVRLNITIKGSGDISFSKIPYGIWRESFEGDFRISDMPPQEKAIQGGKVFSIEMRPLTEDVTVIPSLEFSFFSPQQKRYDTIVSDAIPLEVFAPEASREGEGAPFGAKKRSWEETFEGAKPIEIFGNITLHDYDVTKKRSLLLPWFFAIGGITLASQVAAIAYMHYKRKKDGKMTGKKMFLQALATKDEGKEFFFLIEKAFIMQLKEKGYAWDALPEEGVLGHIKDFFLSLEEARFSGKYSLAQEQVVEEASKLFVRLEEEV
jgi:hypothetical protein